MNWRNVDIWEMPRGEQPHESLYDAVMKSAPAPLVVRATLDLADVDTIETVVSNMDVK